METITPPVMATEVGTAMALPPTTRIMVIAGPYPMMTCRSNARIVFAALLVCSMPIPLLSEVCAEKNGGNDKAVSAR
ncbi:hypothetical protein D3C73_1564170 [compost metagenome]